MNISHRSVLRALSNIKGGAFSKNVNGLDPFLTFAKNSISDLRQGSEYATEPCFS